MRFILFAVLLLASCIAVAGNKEKIIPAEQLYAEYDANEIAADSKYKGKTITIRGRLRDIGVDISGNPYLIVGGSGGFEGVQCSFDSRDKSSLANLKKGHAVTVRGIIHGKMIILSMEQSTLLNN